MADFAPRPKKPSVKNPEMGAYPGCSASSCKSLQPQFSTKSGEIPPTFQRAFLNWECASSNPPRSARQSKARRLCPPQCHKGPPMAGFCEWAIGLRAPEFGSPGAKSPIVSGGYLKCSRFRETGTGDRVRSALRGRRCSQYQQIADDADVRRTCLSASEILPATPGRFRAVRPARPPSAVRAPQARGVRSSKESYLRRRGHA
jgi:hypothetical protein